MPPKSSVPGKTVETITHDEAKRVNIPTSELATVARKEDLKPVQVSYKRRDPDLDPQLIWRGKYDAENMEDGDLSVRAAPLYIQEKVHPKVLIDDLKKESEARAKKTAPPVPQQLNLFSDFNGIPEGVDKTEFYQHEQNWSNRLILGDSLQVMAGLAEREGLRGKVQCIYFDPPYGIKFNSNFQWSTTSRDVKDNKADHITREPEQVKAFRDTWKDGIHSYLSYIRDRLIVARDLLTDSGSIFVQIGDENLHLIKSVMFEIFGDINYVNTIVIKKKGSTLITESMFDFALWFSKNREHLKIRRLIELRKSPDDDIKFNTLISDSGEMIRTTNMPNDDILNLVHDKWKWARVNYPIVSQHPHETRSKDYLFRNNLKKCGSNRQWSFDNPVDLDRLTKSGRIFDGGGSSIAGVVYHEDRPAITIGNLWNDVKGEENPIYVVQTAWKIIQRCILMVTDPGDLVLDPTCGSGTSAYVAEQWGRRWITIDTSRVALALARARLMGARYPYYLLADSVEGQKKEAEIVRSEPSSRPTYGKITHGFVYERVPHITLKSIAKNTEVDVIWEKWQEKLEPLRLELTKLVETQWQEWEIPREIEPYIPSWLTSEFQQRVTAKPVDRPTRVQRIKELHASWWQARIARQKEIDASIAAKADTEYLYDKPYTDKKKVRVAGPFTVESLSPHRMLTVDENDEIIDPLEQAAQESGKDFTRMILEELKTAGVQQASKQDKIVFNSLTPWPGRFINGEGVYDENRYDEGAYSEASYDGGMVGDAGSERRAAIFIGPEFGSVTRQDLVAAAREAADADFDVLIACAFNYDAASADLPSLGRIPILKARMNADLHMSTELKNTGKGNLFIIFGEPDIAIEDVGKNQIQVSIKGVDIFDPAKGEVRSDEPDKIACWFIDTDYNEESFFVRHAYFLGANDPYKSLQATLKAEIDREAWDSLNSAVSRPFDKPKSGRIAVKVINHLGDEVMKVYRV